jgi:predicted HTH transcriptional regulator
MHDIVFMFSITCNIFLALHTWLLRRNIKAMKTSRKSNRGPEERKSSWTFFTNHSHVVFLLARYPDITLRDIASKVGITERAVQRIIEDLVEDDYVVRHKIGRNNTYKVNLRKQLRHPGEAHCMLQDVFRALFG